MIGKGHDVPNVTLVGVVSADMALGLPDFRAGERAFALFTQVVGRAGRDDRPGVALIQTFNPDRYILRAVRGQDYATLWDAESPLGKDQGLLASTFVTCEWERNFTILKQFQPRDNTIISFG